MNFFVTFQIHNFKSFINARVDVVDLSLARRSLGEGGLRETFLKKLTHGEFHLVSRYDLPRCGYRHAARYVHLSGLGNMLPYDKVEDSAFPRSVLTHEGCLDSPP